MTHGVELVAMLIGLAVENDGEAEPTVTATVVPPALLL
jgi:hypothetical protein